MLTVREHDGQDWYVVMNSAQQILIYTTSSAIAHYVESLTPGLDINLRLTVGGDPGSRRPQNRRVFHHVRRY